jgi:predicted nucleic acid-binding protein
VDLEPFLALVAVRSAVVYAAEWPGTITADPADDRFMTCALAGGAPVVVSGDKHLRDVSGWSGIEVLSPRAFVDRYLR